MIVYIGIIHNSKTVETTQMSIVDELIYKMWEIHRIEYCSAIKRNELLIMLHYGGNL